MLRAYDSIMKYVGDLADELVEELQDSAPYSSGELSDSITYKVSTENNIFEMGVFMAEYGIFQDQGVNGRDVNRGSDFTFSKMPPPRVFDKWIVRSGIAPRGKNGKFISRKSLSFAIANSIFKKGIPAKNWINPELDVRLDKLGNIIADEIWKDFSDEENNIN